MPHYLNEVFMKASTSSLRNNYQKLQQIFRKTNTVQMSYLLLIRHCGIKSQKKIKRTTNLNTFKDNLKRHYLKELGKVNF